MYDFRWFSGKMEKFRWPVFFRTFIFVSRAKHQKRTWQEPKNAKRMKTKRRKKNLRCYALQTLRKVNFTETVKRVWMRKRKKLTLLMLNVVLFQVNTSVMRSFCKETSLLRSSASFFALKDANKTFSHFGPYHKSQWSEIYSKKKKKD